MTPGKVFCAIYLNFELCHEQLLYLSLIVQLKSRDLFNLQTHISCYFMDMELH